MKCLNCNKEIKNSNKYCSNICQKEYEYKMYIKDWKSNKVTGLKGEYQISNHIKTYLFNKHNNKCARCGWGEKNEFTGKIPLEVLRTASNGIIKKIGVKAIKAFLQIKANEKATAANTI